MNLIIMYHELYYDFHGTLNLSYASECSLKSSSKVICFYDKKGRYNIINKYKKQFNHIDFIDLSENTKNIYNIIYDEYSKDVEKICLELVSKYEPKKLLFFNEFYFFKYFLKTDIEKIYFVRSLSKPLLKALKNHSSTSSQYDSSIFMEERRLRTESLVIDQADSYIVDSFFSKKMLKKHYQKEGVYISGVIKTDCFSRVKMPQFDLLTAYYIGRTDWQKGLQRIKNPSFFKFLIIGGQILTKGGVSHLSNAKHLGWMKFDQYVPMIEKIPFALFPHLWESNGLTVQEAMTMGKIVIVQEGSGGLEESVQNGFNGFTFDFGIKQDWENFLKKLAVDFDLRYISSNARKTIKKSGYEESLKDLAKIISS